MERCISGGRTHEFLDTQYRMHPSLSHVRLCTMYVQIASSLQCKTNYVRHDHRNLINPEVRDDIGPSHTMKQRIMKIFRVPTKFSNCRYFKFSLTPDPKNP